MSLYHCRILNPVIYLRSLRFLKTLGTSPYSTDGVHGKSVSLEIESLKLDDFTSHLIQKTVNKWCAKKTQRNILVGKKLNQPNCEDDIQALDEDKLNTLFQNAIEVNDNEKLYSLIKQCINQEKCPSLTNLLPTLAICAQCGDKNTINEIIELCRKLQPSFLEPNSHFQHYLAEAVWIRGNIDESLRLFKIVYTENTYLRRRIRLMLKFLIAHVVSNHSEAALITIVKFTEDLAISYKDFFPLTCIWQSCFLSEWFTDQNLALDLLNRNNGLCEAVISRIPFVVAISLRNNRVEAVYRLLEMLLEFEMKPQCEGVLLALLDYQMLQGNTSRCLDIIQWSKENNIQLPPIYNEKFISLQLTKDVAVYRKLLDKINPVVTNYKF